MAAQQLGVGVFYLPLRHGYFLDADSDLWWATLYFCQFAYALASFPYLAFEVVRIACDSNPAGASQALLRNSSYGAAHTPPTSLSKRMALVR